MSVALSLVPEYPELALPRSLLLDADWLEAHLDHPQVRVVDVRGRILPPRPGARSHVARRADYNERHIPGAVFVDWTRDLDGSTWHAELGGHRWLRSAGILPGDVVVAYDDTFNMFASRLVWSLRAVGHASAYVLDGGWPVWLSGARAVTAAPPFQRTGDFSGRKADRMSADDVSLALAADALLLDARLPAYYEGRVASGPRGGHIPGAINLPYNRVVTGDNGTFARPEEVVRTLKRLGIDVGKLRGDVVVYCDTGAMASAVALSLASVGIQRIRVYDKAATEWFADPTRPVVRGPEP